MQALSCSMWDRVPCPDTELKRPALGATGPPGKFTLCVVKFCASRQMHDVAYPSYISYRILYSLKILYTFPVHTSPLLPELLANTDRYILSIVLPFPGCHVIGFIQSVAFLFKVHKNVLMILKSFSQSWATLSPGFQFSVIIGSVFLLSLYLL